MTPYDKIKPRYVREWLVQKRAKWIKLIDDRIAQHRERGQLEEETKMPPVRLSHKSMFKEMGININMSDGGNSVGGSDGGMVNNYMDFDGEEYDMNIDDLESEDEDLKE